MNSSFQLLLLRSAHISLHCVVGLLMPQHSESWTQAMPGESNLLHTLSRKFLPAGLPAGVTSQCWEKGWTVCREMSQVVCTVPVHTVSVPKRMVPDQIIILHLQCLSYIGSDQYALFQIWPSWWMLPHEEHMIALTSIKKKCLNSRF